VRAVTLAEPTFIFMVTLAGTGWPSVQKTMQRVGRYLQAHCSPLGFAWVVEANPQATGLHVHAAARGQAPTREIMDRALRRAGAGRIQDGDLEPITSLGGYSAYLLKNIDNPACVPKATAEVHLFTHLVLNGNRLLHSTHGFWRTPDGNRATLEEVRRSKAPGGDQTWFSRRWAPLSRHSAQVMSEWS